MKGAHFAAAAVFAVSLGISLTASAQPDDPALQLVVEAGRPVRVALDKRVRVKAVGQPGTPPDPESILSAPAPHCA